MGNNTTVHNNVNNSVNKSVNITVKKQVTKKVIEKYPEGSIGRDVIMYSYAKYLADRYVEYRKYDLNEPFKYQVLYGSVMKKFKVGGFFYVPQTRFLDLVVDLQGRIDRTILAKVNKSKGQLKNYSTYEAYKIEMGEKPKMIDLIS
jgi:hypothetical protein